MCFLKRIVPVVVGSILVLSWGHSALSAQSASHGTLQDNRKQLLATNSCPGCDLSGVNLDRVNLTGANLEGANLSRVKLHLATLAQANLRNTDLRGAEFGGSDLAGADLRGADLRGATFVGAYLVGVKLDKEVDLNQPAEELATEAAPVRESGADTGVPVQEEQPASVVEQKNEDRVDVTASKQPIEPTGNKNGTSTPEPGFFDKTLASVKGIFGQGEPDDKKAVTKRTDETGRSGGEIQKAAPAVQAVPVKDVANVAPVKDEPQVGVKGVDGGASAPEPGFFDKTLASVKGIFGQGASDEKKVVIAKTDETGRTGGVIQDAAPSVQAAPVKDIANVPPVKEEEPQAEVKAVVGGASTPEPGFFDKTLASVKGVFQGERDEKTGVTEKTNGVARSDEVTVTPPVVDQANTASAGGEKNDGIIRQENQSPVHESAGSVGSGDKTDPAAVIEKNRQRLLDTKKCYGCNLHGVDLTGKNLDGADLEGADLTGGRLEGADLENANLKGALLVGGDLRNVNLQGADLYKANLSGTDLTGAKLDGAFLDDAQMTDTVGYEQKVGR